MVSHDLPGLFCQLKAKIATQWGKLWTVEATPLVSSVCLEGKCSLIPLSAQCRLHLL